jgi:hypothetical protein
VGCPVPVGPVLKKVSECHSPIMPDQAGSSAECSRSPRESSHRADLLRARWSCRRWSPAALPKWSVAAIL